MSEIDITQLAIDRQPESPQLVVRRNLVSRYVIPVSIVSGFITLVMWSAWDLLAPPREVKVIPVIALQSNATIEGTPLFNAAGWIEPRPTEIRVAALAPGVVEKLLVVEDQRVQKNEPVAELIKEDAELSYERAVADRKLADAELKNAAAALAAAEKKVDQPVHLEAILAEAEAALAKVQTQLKNVGFQTTSAKAQYALAEKNHKRNLDAETSVSRRELDESKAEMETAKAFFEELVQRKNSLMQESKALNAQQEALATQLDLLIDEKQARDQGLALVEAAKAKVEQRKVVEKEAKLRLSRMTIRAPVDGRVYRLVGTPGARVGTGIMTAMETHDASSVITMYQPSSLQIRVDVRFEDIPKVSLEQLVEIDNPALKNPITGKVLFISSEADIQKNTLQVKVSIDSPPPYFKPEMLVDVTFLAPPSNVSQQTSQEQIFINRKYVQTAENGSFVWIADQSEQVARKVSVTTGRSSGPMVQIVEGLRVDHRIISSSTETLENGERIQITSEDNSEE